MPQEKLQTNRAITVGFSVADVEVPEKSFTTHTFAVEGLVPGQRIGVSHAPVNTNQTPGIFVMNSFCSDDGTLTVQFNNTNDAAANVAAGVYTAHIEQGAQHA